MDIAKGGKFEVGVAQDVKGKENSRNPVWANILQRGDVLQSFACFSVCTLDPYPQAWRTPVFAGISNLFGH